MTGHSEDSPWRKKKKKKLLLMDFVTPIISLCPTSVCGDNHGHCFGSTVHILGPLKEVVFQWS